MGSLPPFPNREERERGSNGRGEKKAGESWPKFGNPLIKGEQQNSGNPIRPCTFIDGTGRASSKVVTRFRVQTFLRCPTYRNQVSLSSLLAFLVAVAF